MGASRMGEHGQTPVDGANGTGWTIWTKWTGWTGAEIMAAFCRKPLRFGSPLRELEVFTAGGDGVENAGLFSGCPFRDDELVEETGVACRVR